MKTDLTLAICMYNAEKYIEETLLCIMAQTKQDFYLMIINDCSTDSSADVVNRFFVDHPRQYEMVNLPENRGLAFGRRYVEEHADTKYLLFVDADDCPLPLFVEKLYNNGRLDKYMNLYQYTYDCFDIGNDTVESNRAMVEYYDEN